MSTQLPLYDAPPPYVRHSPTSKAAAVKVRDKADTVRARVLAWFRFVGTATDAELYAAFPEIPNDTLRARRIELTRPRYGRMALVDSGKRRDGRAVWRVRA